MIAIVYPQFFRIGGIARYLESFLANLPPDAARVYLITGETSDGRAIDKRVEVIHIPISHTRIGLLNWSVKVNRLLIELYEKAAIDCVNLHIPPLIPGLFLRGPFPVVVTAHSTYHGMSGRFDGNRNFASPWSGLSLWLKMKMERTIFGKAKSIISLTEHGRQQLAYYGRDCGVTVIPNGVDIARFTLSGNVSKDIDIIFSGRIEVCKGSRPMVEACRRLISARPDIKIAIVGFGDDEEFVKNSLSSFENNVILTGKVPFDEMISYYGRSRIYVSTSYYEGLPGTCLEAMAAGLPVVVWDLLFYRDLVVQGITGLLAPANDQDRLLDCLIRLLRNPQSGTEMGGRGRALVAERYDWKLLSGKLLDVYRLAGVRR